MRSDKILRSRTSGDVVCVARNPPGNIVSISAETFPSFGPDWSHLSTQRRIQRKSGVSGAEIRRGGKNNLKLLFLPENL